MSSSSIGLTELPPEILEHVLKHVPTLDLMRCRRVCSKWRAVIDSMAHSDDFWKKQCAREHPTVYERARAKCSPKLTWEQLYRSLSLWPKLNTQLNTKCIKLYTSKSPSDDNDDVTNIASIQGCVIVYQSDGVLFYNVKGKKTGAYSFGIWTGFEEAENVIVYTLTGIFSSVLCIIKKVNGKPDFESEVVIENVSNFVIVKDDVYYDKYDGHNLFAGRGTDADIYVSRAQDEYETSVKLGSLENEDIVTFGVCNNAPALLSETNDIYVLENDTFVWKDSFDNEDAKHLHKLKTYNFLQCGPIRKALTEEVGFYVQEYCSYGDLMFLGDSNGVLKVYDSAKLIASPLNCKPIAEYNITEMLKIKTKTRNPVTGIDIIEKDDGHFILVSVSKGALAIEISHGLEQNDAVYMNTHSRKRVIPKTYKIVRGKMNNKGQKRKN